MENKLTLTQAVGSLWKNICRALVLVHDTDPFFLYVGLPLSITATLLGYVTVWLSALFINNITEHHFVSIFDPHILILALAYVLVPFISNYCRDTYNYLYDQLYNKFTQHIELLFLRAQYRIDAQTHEDSKFANIHIEALENQYRMFNYIQALFGIIITLVTLSVSLVILARYNPWIAISVVIAFVPQFYVQLTSGGKIWAIWGGRIELRRMFYEYKGYFDHVSNLIELKILGSGEHWISRIHTVLDIFNSEMRQTERRRFILQTLSGLFMIAVVAIITFFFMSNAVTGTLAIGTFLFLESQILSVRNQVTEAVSSVTGFIGANMFVTDIFCYLDTEHVIKDGTIVLPSGAPTIKFTDVSFGYPTGDHRTVLSNINVTIHSGEKVAIVGVNGAGKSTFSKLLMRFYDPTHGSIMINDTPLSDILLDSWHNHIGYLSQEYARYRLPVGEAIAVGNPNIPFSQERAEDAARKAGADTFIRSWKLGYDTPLGTEFDGVEPSIGQWQKLALARLFYKDPDIWILDEPTSSIDAVAELEIFHQLESLPKTKTVILISHRFNTVRNADKIIVIDSGTIAEMGTHDTLMDKQGIYANLFTSQKDSYEEI